MPAAGVLVLVLPGDPLLAVSSSATTPGLHHLVCTYPKCRPHPQDCRHKNPRDQTPSGPRQASHPDFSSERATNLVLFLLMPGNQEVSTVPTTHRMQSHSTYLPHEMWPTHAGCLEASSCKSLNVRAGLGMVAYTCNLSGLDEEMEVSKAA